MSIPFPPILAASQDTTLEEDFIKYRLVFSSFYSTFGVDHSWGEDNPAYQGYHKRFSLAPQANQSQYGVYSYNNTIRNARQTLAAARSDETTLYRGGYIAKIPTNTTVGMYASRCIVMYFALQGTPYSVIYATIVGSLSAATSVVYATIPYTAEQPTTPFSFTKIITAVDLSGVPTVVSQTTTTETAPTWVARSQVISPIAHLNNFTFSVLNSKTSDSPEYVVGMMIVVQ